MLCGCLLSLEVELCVVLHGDDPGVGDADGGRGDEDRLGGPIMSPPRLPMSKASSSGESGIDSSDGVGDRLLASKISPSRCPMS